MSDARRIAFDIFAVDRASETFEKISRKGEEMGGRFGKVGGMIGGALVGAATLGIGALTAAVGEGLKGAIEYQQIQAQTAARLKSTGGAAHVTAEGVASLTESISSYSTFSQDAATQGANLLLSFTNIRNGVGKNNDIFNQANKVLADMATALGQTPAEAAVKLGRALQDPAKGMTALTRVGVTFTDAQKKVIKHLEATGHMADAQRVILGALETKFGGSAKAAGDTFAGSLTRLKNSGMDMLRNALMPLLPVLTKLVGWVVANVIPAFKSLVEHIGQRLVPILKLAAAWFEQHILPVLKALAGWVTGSLIPAFRKMIDGVLPGIINMFKSFGDTLGRHKKLIDDVKTGFSVLGTFITKFFYPVIGGVVHILTNVLGPAFTGIVWIIQNLVWPVIKTLIKMWVDGLGLVVDGAAKAFGWIPGLGPKLRNAAKAFDKFRNDVNAALDGIHKNVNISLTGTFKNPTVPNKAGISGKRTVGYGAEGAVIRGAQLIVAGEAGPEVLMPLNKVGSNQPLSSLGGHGSGNVYITVQGWVGNDKQLATKITAELQRLKHSGVRMGLA